MTQTISHEVSIRPIIRYPQHVEVAKSYLLTVDIEAILDENGWPYDREEYTVFCEVSGGELFDVTPVGERAVVLHRFGGTYGPARYVLTVPIGASVEKQIGLVQIKLFNGQGYPLDCIEITDIQLAPPAADQRPASDLVEVGRLQPSHLEPVAFPAPQPSSIELPTISSTIPQPPSIEVIPTPTPDHFAFDVFVSYAHADSAWVRDELLPRLEGTGLKVCIDQRDFRPGVPSVIELERGMRDSRWTVPVLTPAYLDSTWSEFEALMLATFDPADRQLRLIPLLKERCNLPLEINYLTYINFAVPNDPAWSWTQLLTALGAPPPQQTSLGPAESPHPALQLRHTLRGHTDSVSRMALSSDGRTLASPSDDQTVRLWDVETGRISRTLKHQADVVCVAWSPDGAILASGGGDLDKRVHLWEAATGRQRRTLEEHSGTLHSVVWSPDGKMLASCSSDETIRLWDTASGRSLRELEGHTQQIEGVAWSPDGRWLCSGSWDTTVRLWDVATGKTIRTLTGHRSFVISVAWSPGPNRQYIASGSEDQSVRIWDPETGLQEYVLEGHTAPVVSVSFLDDGRFLASLGQKGMVILWRTDTWAEVLRVDKIGDAGPLANLAAHPTLPLLVAPGPSRDDINIWSLDFARLRGVVPITSTDYYVNAKVVLLGDSGVGKSGLGIRLANGIFRSTYSTHGAQFWHFPTERLPALPPNVQAEVTLWDLAGQPEYRLTHQLFLDDADAALLLFDCSDPDDPFRGVPYWAKVLEKHAPPHALKFLVSARSDVSPVTVNHREINRVLAQYGLDEYFKTSAKTGEGVAKLFERLMSSIPWDRLPRTSTPPLFQAVREYLLERKAAGATLIAMDEVRRAAAERFTGRATTQAELDTVVQLLQSRGLVHRLDPRPGVAWVLLKPELINQYGTAIIQAARNHPEGIGAVAERDVLSGSLPFAGFERLPLAEEALVLSATTELLIRLELGIREMGTLVFPSQINVARLPPNGTHPRTEVAYRFSGGIETIYASLVVQLSYSGYFRREEQWKYAVEFSRGGNRLGFSMRQVEEGTGELEIYFYPGVSEFDRITFIHFIAGHLRAKGIDIHEQIRLYCPKCGKEVTDRKAIEARGQDGKPDIACQYCDTPVVILRSIEEIYRRNPALGEMQQQLAETVEKRTEAEVAQFRADQQRIHILHLADLHLENEAQAQVCRTQLETDLIRELGVRRLEYLVISGDVANRSTEEEYSAAFHLLDGLVKRFGLDASRVVVVPGNHDLNWDLSEAAYPFVPKRKLPVPLSEGRFIPAGDAGALLRDDEMYRGRFANFNAHFYRRVYAGQDYPTAPEDQLLFVEQPEDRILFLGLNSCWQIDHHYRDRAGIHMPALARALDRLQEGTYDGWLKIAVWHHPVTGPEMMNDEFMQLLAVHRFQVCLHGHVHEAKEGFYKHDEKSGIHIIGAGTFGTPTREQTPNIPLQYNLLTPDPETRTLTVETRKKERPDGTWAVDARWGDKSNPSPRYTIQLKNWNHPSMDKP